MTIPQDNALSFTMGHFFALAGSDAIQNEGGETDQCLLRARLFTAFVAVPIGVYFNLRWPDWDWMYLAGDRSRSPAVRAAGLGAYFLSNELGYRHAARLIMEGRTDEAAIRGVASLSLLALISAAWWRRFRWQGSREEYEAGTAHDVLKSWDFHISMAVTGSIFLSAAAYVIHRNRRT